MSKIISKQSVAIWYALTALLATFLVGLLINCFILSALYHKTQNLWICVMTHALINALSQILVNEDGWLSLVSKILIISLAIMIARKKSVTLKEEK